MSKPEKLKLLIQEDHSTMPYVPLKSEKSSEVQLSSLLSSPPENHKTENLELDSDSSSINVPQLKTFISPVLQKKMIKPALSGPTTTPNSPKTPSFEKQIARHNSLNRAKRFNKTSLKEKPRRFSANTPSSPPQTLGDCANDLSSLSSGGDHTEKTRPTLTRTNSNASNISNFSQTTHELFLSISSDLSGLASQSSHIFDDLFGFERSKSQGNNQSCFQCLLS